MKESFFRRAFLVVVVALGAIVMGWAEDGKVRRDGFDLYYRTEGNGTPVVLVSGGPGFDVDYMKEVGGFLPGDYQRIYLEQRGTGRSMPPSLSAETVNVKLWVEDLEALRVALKQERLFLVAHSGGGLLAQAYASAHPDRVDRMILIGPGGPTLEFASWLLDNLAARQTPEDQRLMAYWNAAESHGVDHEKAMLERVRVTTAAYFFDRAKGLAWAAAIPEGSFHARMNELVFADLAKGYDARPGLRKLQCPVLIVQGHQDPIGDLTALEIHNTIPGSQLTFLGQCGHYPWVERPDAFRKVVTEFLKKTKEARMLSCGKDIRGAVRATTSFFETEAT
ncbi:alpha/beta fold hydrolase [Fimbriimonas ginsengisoli]|nr:alpha/beta hydrolase [Fimbriimonas ginsengisoli]